MDSTVRILVVDPDLHSRRLVKAAVESIEPASINEVTKSTDCLEHLKNNPNIKLVIIDPSHFNVGWPFIKTLRDSHPQLAILVLSVVFNNKTIAQAMEMGADDYLFKPVDLAELRRTVTILLKPKKPSVHLVKEIPVGEHEKLSVSSEEDGTFLNVTVATGSPHVERFVCFAKRLLEKNLEAQECFSVRQALEEMVTNAMEWGNRGDTTKLVKLSYCILHDRVALRIEDQGEGFKPASIPDPSVDPVAHVKRRKEMGKRIGGWGLFLTSKAVDEVTYNEKGNVVLLTKMLNKPARSPSV